MSNPAYQTPGGEHFARTNRQTIAQRATLIRELLPGTKSIGELCCGDCIRQAEAYRMLRVARYVGLDLSPQIVAANRAQGIDCLQGDVLDPAVLRQFLDFDLLCFGPPLSIDCDGHRLLGFDQVTPGYAAFTRRLWGELGYQGTVIYICPNTTNPADLRRLYDSLRLDRPEVGLRLVCESWSTVTGLDEPTPPRLKYVEAWFSTVLPDAWEFRRGVDGYSGRSGDTPLLTPLAQKSK